MLQRTSALKLLGLASLLVTVRVKSHETVRSRYLGVTASASASATATAIYL